MRGVAKKGLKSRSVATTRPTQRYRPKATIVPGLWGELFILDSSRTIVGLAGRVKGLPARLFRRIGEEKGIGARGATDPRGGTLSEDHVISVAPCSHIGRSEERRVGKEGRTWWWACR